MLIGGQIWTGEKILHGQTKYAKINGTSEHDRNESFCVLQSAGGFALETDASAQTARATAMFHFSGNVKGSFCQWTSNGRESWPR
jgi:hypothetical protein